MESSDSSEAKCSQDAFRSLSLTGRSSREKMPRDTSKRRHEAGAPPGTGHQLHSTRHTPGLLPPVGLPVPWPDPTTASPTARCWALGAALGFPMRSHWFYQVSIQEMGTRSEWARQLRTCCGQGGTRRLPSNKQSCTSYPALPPPSHRRARGTGPHTSPWPARSEHPRLCCDVGEHQHCHRPHCSQQRRLLVGGRLPRV